MKIDVYVPDGSLPLDSWKEPDVFIVIREGERDLFSAADGCPEDNGLYRNFNDCFSIPDLMQIANEAGLRGEPLKIETHRIPEYPS
jgi:hypothetical protein